MSPYIFLYSLLNTVIEYILQVYRVSQKSSPPEVFWHFFQNSWEFFDQILQACYICSYLTILQIFIQLSATLLKLCHIKRDHPSYSSHRKRKMSTISRNARWHFMTFSPSSWEYLVQILHAYCPFLSTLEYKFLLNISPTVTKLCHTKCDHPACVQPIVNILSI